MRRKNSRRVGDLDSSSQLGAPDAAAAMAEQRAIKNSTEGSNSDFSFPIGIDVVDLPSKGDLYPEEHQMHGISTIELKHMTAKE